MIQDQLVWVLNKKKKTKTKRKTTKNNNNNQTKKEQPTKPPKTKKNLKESNIHLWTGEYVSLALDSQVEAFVVLVLYFSPQGVLLVEGRSRRNVC